MSNAKTNAQSHQEPKNDRLGGLVDAARRATAGADANPLALVAGGLALGVIVGALLPRSDRERELLAPVGAKLGTGLTAAVQAAREAGQAELAEAGISRDAARDQVKSLIDGLLKAAGSAGTAAAQAASGKTAS